MTVRLETILLEATTVDFAIYSCENGPQNHASQLAISRNQQPFNGIGTTRSRKKARPMNGNTQVALHVRSTVCSYARCISAIQHYPYNIILFAIICP